MSANQRFDLWLQSPQMRQAERAFRTMDSFWAERREEGLRNTIASESKAQRYEYDQLKRRMQEDR